MPEFYQNKKRNNNFYLNNEEKTLFFNLKKIHKLNNKLGSIDEPYYEYLKKMNEYYENILNQFNYENTK